MLRHGIHVNSPPCRVDTGPVTGLSSLPLVGSASINSWRAVAYCCGNSNVQLNPYWKLERLHLRAPKSLFEAP